jgi:fibronectin-binding autotransporter adhesin
MGRSAIGLNGASADTFFSGDNVFFDDTALTNLVTMATQQQPGSMTVSNETKPYRFGGAAGITAGGLLKQGASSLTFTNAGTLSYGGGLTINAGGVNFANGNTATFGGTVALNAGSLTFSNAGANSFAALAITSGTAQLANAGANAFASPISLDGGTLSLNQAVDSVLAASITNQVISVAGSLSKDGPNSVLLSGNNAAFDGPVLVNSGILRAGAAGALGTINSWYHRRCRSHVRH